MRASRSGERVTLGPRAVLQVHRAEAAHARGRATHARPSPGEAALVRLTCVDDDAQGEKLTILCECDADPGVSVPA
jgi:hypothetical protein